MENYRTSRRNVRYKSSSPSPEISESKFRTVHDLVAVLHDEDFPGPWFPPASFGLVTCSPENVGSRPRRTRVAPHCWFFSTENSECQPLCATTLYSIFPTQPIDNHRGVSLSQSRVVPFRLLQHLSDTPPSLQFRLIPGSTSARRYSQLHSY